MGSLSRGVSRKESLAGSLSQGVSREESLTWGLSLVWSLSLAWGFVSCEESLARSLLRPSTSVLMVAR